MTEVAKDAKSRAIVDTLRGRFVTTAIDKLDAIDAALAAGPRDGQCAEIKRNAHSLKGMAGSFGFMSVTRISEAFESYLSAAEKNGAEITADARCYNDVMRAIIEGGDEPSEDETDGILATLPKAPRAV